MGAEGVAEILLTHACAVRRLLCARGEAVRLEAFFATVIPLPKNSRATRHATWVTGGVACGAHAEICTIGATLQLCTNRAHEFFLVRS